VTEEEGIAGGSADHRKHCQPHIRQRLRREPSVTDAKHVRHGFEKCPRVLLQPKRFLSSLFEKKKIKDFMFVFKIFLK
jgi:hypothetical protein